MKKRLHNRRMFFAFALLAIVAFLIAPTLYAIGAGLVEVPAVVSLGITAMATSPFLISRMCLDSGGEGGGPSLADIGEKVEKGIGALRTEQKSLRDQLTGDISNLDKQSKGLLEDITKLKTVANETQAGRDELLKKINLLDARIQAQVRHSTNPIQRICQDEELRTRFNLAVRLAMSKDGDMHRLMAPQLKALGEDSSPGSTLINDALAKEIYDTLATFGVWNTFGVRNLGTKLTKFPIKTARPIAKHILTENTGQLADDTNKAGSSVSLTVEVIGVLLNVSLQLLQDAEFDVTADVMSDFAEAYAKVLDYDCISADGTADETNGGMTGILSGWTAAAAASGNSTVEGTDLEDWLRVLLAVDPVVLTRGGARWWTNPQNLVRALAVRDENGRPLFQTALEVPTAGGIGSILGYPITLSHVYPATNAAAAKPFAFGDPQAQVVGIRSDYVFESSDHHKWDYLERSFRGWGRAGVKIRAATGGAYLRLTA